MQRKEEFGLWHVNVGPRTPGCCADVEFRGKVFTGELNVECGDYPPLESGVKATGKNAM